MSGENSSDWFAYEAPRKIFLRLMDLLKPLTFKEIILTLIEDMLLSIFILCDELMRH